jgi:hypothetical protein
MTDSTRRHSFPARVKSLRSIYGHTTTARLGDGRPTSRKPHLR